MTERLVRKGFAQDVISTTIEDLKKAGFIDDRALAVGLKRQAYEGKLLGHGAARIFMYRRGLTREVVDAVLQYDEDEELQTLRRLLEKKTRLSGEVRTPVERRKLWNFLLRKGYSTSIIRRAIQEIDFDEEAS